MEERDTRSLSEDTDLQREERIHRRGKAEVGEALSPERKNSQIVRNLNASLQVSMRFHEIPQILTLKFLFFNHIISFQQILSLWSINV